MDGFILYPMTAVGNAEFAVWRIDEAAKIPHRRRHYRQVVLAIDKERGHPNPPVRILRGLGPAAHQRSKDVRTIVVDCRRQRPRLAHGLFVSRNILFAESAGANGSPA